MHGYEHLMFPVAFWIFFAVIIAIGIARKGAREAELVEHLEHLRRMRRGSVGPRPEERGAVGGCWRSTLVGETARVYYHSTGGRHALRSTRLEIGSSRHRFPRMEIHPQYGIHAIAKLFGMQDVEIGVPAIDDAYILKAENEQWLRSFLDPGVQRRILELEQLRPAGLHLHSRAELFELRVDRWLEDVRLVAFHDAGLEIAAAMLGESQSPAAAGVQILEAPARPSTGGTCLVCGRALAGTRTVRCRRCDTSHHDECWNYNGSCAVYGCASAFAQRERPR
jgi:hypothetical protein